MGILSQYHIFDLDTIYIYSVEGQVRRTVGHLEVLGFQWDILAICEYTLETVEELNGLEFANRAH
jgi:hypothetical protein